MNSIQLFQSVLAFGIGVISLFLVYTLIRFYLKNNIKIEVENDALAVFKAGIILSCANLMSAVIGPGINVIRFLNQDAIVAQTILRSAGFVTLFVFIGITFSIVVIAGGVAILFQLTHVNEWEELKNNKLKTAIISVALIIGLSIIMKDQVSIVCEMFIPYPKVMQVH